MAVVLSAEDVWDMVGSSLAGPLPSRPKLWEMARALQLAEGQLVRGLDNHAVTAAQRQRSQRALRGLQQELVWIERHSYGVLRCEIADALRRAHRCFGMILAILREVAGPGCWRGPGPTHR